MYSGLGDKIAESGRALAQILLRLRKPTRWTAGCFDINRGAQMQFRPAKGYQVTRAVGFKNSWPGLNSAAADSGYNQN
jgi:hypothetical protein